MYDRPLTIEQVLTLLAETPPRLAALTVNLASAQLQTRPSAAEWSLNDILAHLRSCSDMWGSYMRTILAEDRPTIRAMNPTTWIKQTDYPELEFRPSLRAFTRQRAELLAVLQPLPAKTWSRSATVTGAGKPRQRTVMSYAQWLANHEQSHFRHIVRLVDALPK
jgi:DinB superfamily